VSFSIEEFRSFNKVTLEDILLYRIESFRKSISISRPVSLTRSAIKIKEPFKNTYKNRILLS
jgi:hypothetical protein